MKRSLIALALVVVVGIGAFTFYKVAAAREATSPTCPIGISTSSSCCGSGAAPVVEPVQAPVPDCCVVPAN